MFSYRPEFMGKKHEVTGCWVLLQLDSANEICKVPTYVKPPLHTRVFDGEPFPSILVCLLCRLLNIIASSIHGILGLRLREGLEFR